MKHGGAIEALKAPQQVLPTAAWMLTFADLTSLLLCFFVLFYATLSIDKPYWQTVVGSFNATFAQGIPPLAVMPTGQPNALPVVVARRSALYLDSLLRQRLAADPFWVSLVGQANPLEGAVSYPLSFAQANLTNPATLPAWQRLGQVVRTWDTPVALRVIVPAGEAFAPALARAWPLAQAAVKGGARVTLRATRGKVQATEWVIYSAD